MADDQAKEIAELLQCIAIDFTKKKADKVIHSFYIPKVLYELVIGPGKKNIEEIERATNTKICIPDAHTEQQEIVITGLSEQSVKACCEKLNERVKFAEKRISHTHLIIIPLNTKIITSNYNKFKSDILNDPKQMSRGITEGLFSHENRLHITIGRLCLVDDKHKDKAITTLKACIKEIIEPFMKKQSPLVIKIKGFHECRFNWRKCFGLYGKVLMNQDLRSVVYKITDYFKEKGFPSVRYPLERMHMPLIKAVRSNKTGQHDACDRSLQGFDATKILQDFPEYDFGELTLKTIKIVEIASGDKDGNYLELAREDVQL